MTSSTATIATSTSVLKVEPSGAESSTIDNDGSGMDPLNTSFVNESQEIRDENMDSGSATVTSIVETGGKPIVIILAAIGTFIVVAVVVAVIMFLKYK